MPGKQTRVRRTSRDVVHLPRAEYERLLAKAGERVDDGGEPMPRLPQPDAHGHLPAVEFIRASIAREVLRRRKAARLSQSELAKRARTTQETVSHIETGRHTVSAAVITRIERALQQAERSTARTSPAHAPRRRSA